MKLRKRLFEFISVVGMVFAQSVSPSQAQATPTYAYEVGFNLNNVVAPGSSVPVMGTLRNVGSLPIEFAPVIISGFPSITGGSVPFGSSGAGMAFESLGTFTFTEEFFSQFNGVVIAPGNSFDFLFGIVDIRAEAVIGISGHLGAYLGINFTDDILGNMNGVDSGGPPFPRVDGFSSHGPQIRFTVGNNAASDNLCFTQGIVVERSAEDPNVGTVVSAPSTTGPCNGLFTAFLHGSGANANPSVLFLDNSAPTSSTAKFRDSSGIKFAGGNPWKVIGTWVAEPGSRSGMLSELHVLDVWVGLKNSDDVGTRFDLAAEVRKNGTLVAHGETLCITGVVRNPASAALVGVVFQPFSPVTFDGINDVLSLKLYARIGTDGAGGFCGGHSSATGLRLYFGAPDRTAQFMGELDQDAQ
jgi:hypothetical protein